MRFTFLVCVTAVMCFVTALAKCPEPGKGRIRKNGRLLCARAFEHGSSDKRKSCTGLALHIFDGAKERHLGKRLNDKISSVVVQYGCRLTVYEHANFSGHRRQLYEGVHGNLKHVRMGFWRVQTWNDIISSFKCKCA